MPNFRISNYVITLPTTEQRVLTRQYYRSLRQYCRIDDARGRIMETFLSAGVVDWRLSVPS
jgi:hypothetical protein